MTTEQIVIDGIKIVCAYLLGVLTEGRLMAKHYRKKLQVEQEYSKSLVAEYERYKGVLEQQRDTWKLMYHNAQKGQGTFIETLGSLITEPDEISEEEWAQQQIYLKSMDKVPEGWTEDKQKNYRVWNPIVPEDKDEEGYGPETGHDIDNKTKTTEK